MTNNRSLSYSHIKLSEQHFNGSLELAAFELHKDALLHAALESNLKRVKEKLDDYFNSGFFECDENYLRSLQALEIVLERVLSFSLKTEGTA